MKQISVNLSEDSFIHFTYEDRATQIIKSGKLLSDPPYAKFGIAGVQAISVNHGQFIPGVQLSHLEIGDTLRNTIVAIWFKTSSIPKYGYPEEVIWEGDVKLINPQIISVEEAKRMLSPRTKNNDYMLLYESLISVLL